MIDKIKQAIFQATGQTFEEYAVKSKKLKYFFPRMIFAYKCHESGVSKSKLSKDLNQTWATVHHSINRYDVEIMTNSKFRLIVYHVNYYLTINNKNQ